MSARKADVLERILRVKREDVAQLRRRYSEATLREHAAAAAPARGFAAALSARAERGESAVIAEIKKASPSKGLIRADFDPVFLAREYESGGCACLSVLTDEAFFQGANEYLVAARAACALPVIRKDFLIDASQVYEARGLGADCVLLIAAALAPAQLAELAALARTLGMDVLIEIHDRTELDAMLALNLPRPVLLGINNRDLRTFETRLETTLELLPAIPPGYEVVSESGIFTREHVARLRAAGVRRFLIGESLMRQSSPGAALRELLAAGGPS